MEARCGEMSENEPRDVGLLFYRGEEPEKSKTKGDSRGIEVEVSSIAVRRVGTSKRNREARVVPRS